MPVPSPIIAASWGLKVGTSNTSAMSSSPPSPTPSAKSAVMIGNPIAMTDPNERSRMTIAARRPNSSLAGSLGRFDCG